MERRFQHRSDVIVPNADLERMVSGQSFGLKCMARSMQRKSAECTMIWRIVKEHYLTNLLKTILQRRATYRSSKISKLLIPSQLEVNVQAKTPFAKWSTNIVR
mmetsp:Transcript_9392/g.33158  ORF Transcript_9392/g.33158 Transcript_9392/m.33158 type:complete len:103 (-) Transcript_9392:1855-2163(-)